MTEKWANEVVTSKQNLLNFVTILNHRQTSTGMEKPKMGLVWKLLLDLNHALTSSVIHTTLTTVYKLNITITRPTDAKGLCYTGSKLTQNVVEKITVVEVRLKAMVQCWLKSKQDHKQILLAITLIILINTCTYMATSLIWPPHYFGHFLLAWTKAQ